MARRSGNANHLGARPALAAPYVDRDVEAMLCKSQPGHFDGKGTDVGRKPEEWLEKMDDYFDLAQSNADNRATMGRH